MKKIMSKLIKKYVFDYIRTELNKEIRFRVKRSLFQDLHGHEFCTGEKLDLSEDEMEIVSDIVSKHVSISVDWKTLENRINKLK